MKIIEGLENPFIIRDDNIGSGEVLRKKNSEVSDKKPGDRWKEKKIITKRI